MRRGGHGAAVGCDVTGQAGIQAAVATVAAVGVLINSAGAAVPGSARVYGAFVAKVLLVQTRRLPGWVLPAARGTLAVVVGVLWYTSALGLLQRLPATRVIGGQMPGPAAGRGS